MPADRQEAGPWPSDGNPRFERRDGMGWRSVIAVGLIGVFGLTGCSSMRERRWGWCAVGGGVVGAAIGAGTAGGLVNGYGNPRHDHENTGIAAGSGAVGGGLLGALIGHMICDPVEE